MYSDKDIGKAMNELKDVHHELKAQDLSIRESVSLFEKALLLYKDIQTSYFSKSMRVLKVQKQSSEQLEEVPFSI